jgi:hypothetical protein
MKALPNRLQALGMRARSLAVPLLYLVATLVFFLVATTNNDWFDGDIASWCLDSLTTSRCLGGSQQLCGQISKFPLGYALNSFLQLEAANYNNSTPFLSLFFAVLNSQVLALPILLLGSIRNFRGQLVAWGIYVFAWLLTPIPRFYLFTGSLEVQAGVAVGLAIVFTFRSLVTRNVESMADRSPSLSSILVCNGLWFIACLYKDTSVFTFAVVGLLLLFCDQAWRRSVRQSLWQRQYCDSEELMTAKETFKASLFAKHQQKMLCLTVPALIAATFAEASFNLIRYQTVLPEAYLNEASLTTTPFSFRLQSLFWSIASPNGGLVVFWGLCFAVLCLYGLRRIRQEKYLFSAVKAATLWALITLMGLSLWWNPFGWASWGDRLMVPAMMAIVICFWEALINPRRLQAVLAQAHSGESVVLGQTSPRQRKPLSKPALLASYLLFSLLVFVSLPYVALGYQANGMDVRHHPAPDLIHCAKMMRMLDAIPVEKHLAFVYSGETWRQCALESYRYNPAQSR